MNDLYREAFDGQPFDPDHRTNDAVPEPPPPTIAEAPPANVREARQQGFSAEEIDAFIQAGILPKPEGWYPTTVADVEWIALKLKECDDDIARRTRQLEKQVADIMRRRKSLERFDADCADIIYAALPKQKTHTLKRRIGEPTRKSIHGDQFTLKHTGGRQEPKVKDETALLEFIRQRCMRLPQSVVEAVRVTINRKHVDTGRAAFLALRASLSEDDVREVKVLHEPVKTYVESLPKEQVIDTQTGTVLSEKPATIPGVEWVTTEPSWSFKSESEADE